MFALFVLDEYTFQPTNKLSWYPVAMYTAEGADKYETGTNVPRTTKKTPLTTFMKDEE